MNLIGTFVWSPISCFLNCHPSFCCLRPHCLGFLPYGSRRAQVRPACDAMVHGQGWKRRLLPHEQYAGLPDLFVLAQCSGTVITWQKLLKTYVMIFSFEIWVQGSFQKTGRQPTSKHGGWGWEHGVETGLGGEEITPSRSPKGWGFYLPTFDPYMNGFVQFTKAPSLIHL